MLRGFYTAASGMIAQQRHQETVSNNIANANTPGYKADQATLRAFPEMLIQEINNKHIPTQKGLDFSTARVVGGLNTGAYAQELVADFSQGSLRHTELATDIALENGALPDEEGGLFFAVENDEGEARFTRNGNFTVDAEGFLTNNQGLYVLDNNGNTIQPDTDTFTVSPEGLLETEDEYIAQLNVSYIDNVNNLEKEGDSLYRLEEGEAVLAEAAGAGYQIRQDYLEGSTVDAEKAMTEMIRAYRNFEQNQRVLRTYDESMGKAVNEIARLG